MSGQNTAFVVYAIPTAAMRAIERLRNSECEVEFSVVAQEERETKQNKELIYDSWYQLWSLLPDWSRFGIPQMGPVLMTGPMSRLMVNVLNNASMFDGLNALEACLHSIGVPGDKILACEAAVQAGGILVLIHGTSQEVARAREIVANASTTYKESDPPPY